MVDLPCLLIRCRYPDLVSRVSNYKSNFSKCMHMTLDQESGLMKWDKFILLKESKSKCKA